MVQGKNSAQNSKRGDLQAMLVLRYITDGGYCCCDVRNLSSLMERFRMPRVSSTLILCRALIVLEDTTCTVCGRLKGNGCTGMSGIDICS